MKDKAEQIVGRLSQEETADVLRECLRTLPFEVTASVLNDELTLGQLEEVLEVWP